MSPARLALSAAVVTGSLCAAALMAQSPTPSSTKPSFEVASVRLNTSGENKVMMGVQPGGRFTAVNIPLRALIRNAYQLQDFQIVGAPDWIATDRYDVTAKFEGEMRMPMPGGPPSPVQLMLQSLFEERFKLAVHRETREMPIYALVLVRADGKLGPQLTPSTVDCAGVAAARRGGPPPGPPTPGERPVCGIRMGFGEISGGGFGLGTLASQLSQMVQRVVVDKSGLSGNFDFEVKFTPDNLPPPPPGAAVPAIDPNGPSIFTAVQEQLGLKLDSQRGPVEVLVVDHIERPAPD